MKKVVLVELTVLERVIPLVSSYLQAYACKDAVIKSNWFFEKYTVSIATPKSRILSDLSHMNADVYAFSCYCWNTGLVRSILSHLLADNSKQNVILGGPQVENCGEMYLCSENENFVLCNGEGEKTFYNYLLELMNARPDFSTIRGLSFYKDGHCITNNSEKRIVNLDEIPSPFLNGIIETNKYSTVIFETNRGCPYQCKFCYWGASSKVNRFSEERIREELTWLAKNNFFYIWIVDGNWGLFDRDEELSRHIATNKRKYKMPNNIYFHGAKNNPERLIRIIESFHEVGIGTPLSIAFQSMTPEVLKNVGRSNVAMKTFMKVQKQLNKKKLSSHLELIWPLPGETLMSFKEGVHQLCSLDAESFLIYPFLLLNNIQIARERDKFKLVTAKYPGDTSELEIVIGTDKVSFQEYTEGIWFIFAVVILYCLRCLKSFGYYLYGCGKATYDQLFSEFVDYCQRNREYPLVKMYEQMIADLTHVDFHSIGYIIHFVLHTNRDDFEEFLINFVTSSKWWADEEAQFYFEIDLLNRPFVYINTPIEEKQYPFRYVSVLQTTDTGFIVEITAEYEENLHQLVELMDNNLSDDRIYHINHRVNQFAYVHSNTPEQNAIYCEEKLHAMRNILPIWSAIEKSSFVIDDTLNADTEMLQEEAGDFDFM